MSRLTTACSAAGRHKVLRRGRDNSPRKIFMRARVREALCPRADAGR
jgi:hypothetical protein